MAATGLPRQARLRRAADFAALRKARGRVAGRFFQLRYGPNLIDTARLGLAVSRRVSKRAVERNRIKRLVRETFRHSRGGLPCVDILVIARTDAARQPATLLLAELEQLWQRVQPLKPAPVPGTIVR